MRTTPNGRCAPASRSSRSVGELANAARARSSRRAIGIATGLVVVGDLVGEGAAQEQAVVGDTPNLAARLQALAEPGSVVVADSTRRLLGERVRSDASGAAGAEGLRRAGPGLGGAAAKPRTSAGSRRRASARHDAVRRTRARERRCCWTAGATRARAKARSCCSRARPASASRAFSRRCAEQIGDEPHVRLRYQCSPLPRQRRASIPFVPAIWRAAGFAPQEPPAARLDKLEAVLAPRDRPAERGRAAYRRRAVDPGRGALSRARHVARAASARRRRFGAARRCSRG